MPTFRHDTLGVDTQSGMQSLVLLILPEWVSALWWLMFLEAPKEVVELLPAVEVIVPGPSGQREPCKNPAWKLLAARIKW